MKIEILYPELCHLYGDKANVSYLKKQLKDATFYETSLKEKPRFTKEKIDFIYLGSASEKNQNLIRDALLPHLKKIWKTIEEGTCFLVTGSTLDIFGTEIIENDEKIKGLGLFPFYTTRDYNHRHNSLFLGTYNNMEIVGFKSSFTYSYPKTTSFPYWIKGIRGEGMNQENNMEGITFKNFFGTTLLGPFLILNPDFTKYLLKLLKQDDTLIYEDAFYKAYHARLKEFKDPNTTMIVHH